MRQISRQTRPKGEEKVEAKAEAKVDAKAEAKAEAQTEAEAEAQVEAKVDAKVEAKVEAQVEAKVGPKVEAKAEAQAEAKAEAQAEAKAEAKAEATVEANTGNTTPLLGRSFSMSVGRMCENMPGGSGSAHGAQHIPFQGRHMCESMLGIFSSAFSSAHGSPRAAGCRKRTCFSQRKYLVFSSGAVRHGRARAPSVQHMSRGLFPSSYWEMLTFNNYGV